MVGQSDESEDEDAPAAEAAEEASEEPSAETEAPETVEPVEPPVKAARPTTAVVGEPLLKPLAPPEPLPVVTFDKVTKRYGNFTAIKDVSFSIEDRPGRGEFVCILGPSGCGKSTVIRLIAGLTPQFPASSGRVLVDGNQVMGPGPARGMVFQDYTSFDNRSVLDNIAFGLECRGVAKSERNDLARLWIDKVGLSVKKDADKYPHQLSGGMRQRVAIARTLILEPRIILMDEPFGALDPPTRSRMQEVMIKLWREQSPSIFLITHSIEEAVYLADTIIIFSSSPGTVLQVMKLDPPHKPPLEAMRDPEFLDTVFEIRSTIEKLETSNRAGD